MFMLTCLGELRRVPSHPSSDRDIFSDKNFSWIVLIKAEQGPFINIKILLHQN